MTYPEAREFTASLGTRGIRPGLENINALCNKLGDPQDKLNIVHISGTNGKGSVGAFLASVLNAAGKSCARFVSPAVEEYLEAFTVNGKSIEETDYAAAAELVQKAIGELEGDGISPTSFEAETAMAFCMFARSNPDYVLIECGMGGALDSTNVVRKPLVSVITSISLDHRSFLGSTLSEIAAQKSGIIKKAVPVVTCMQEPEALSVIRSAANRSGSSLYITEPSDIEYYDRSTTFMLDDECYTIGLLGTYQPQNAAIAVKAAQLLGIDGTAIHKGLENASWSCRFERIGKFILDGAHNEGAARELSESLSKYLKSGTTAFICGIFRDKDYKRIAQLTAKYADTVYTVTPPTSRGLENTELAGFFSELGVQAYPTDLTSAIRAARSCDNVVIFGTLSVLGDAKRIIHKLSSDMERCNLICTHPLYRERMSIIESSEKTRQFCLHNFSHSLDVARIGYIKILEESLDIDKELFYAAALLHDAGRYSGKPHNESGAELAKQIMPECGFSEQETNIVFDAIAAHRKSGGLSQFSALLYYADKKSRMCFDCSAADECYWNTEKRNFDIEV